MTRVRFQRARLHGNRSWASHRPNRESSHREAAELFRRVLTGSADAQQQELFRAQMLTEMARMSLDDGLVMQIHPGSARNHNR